MGSDYDVQIVGSLLAYKTDIKSPIRYLSTLFGHRGSTDDLLLLQIFPVVLFGSPGTSNCHATRCHCCVLVFASL